MAENATDTTPGTHPDAVVINDDGTVTTRHGLGFVWCTDKTTGNRMDIPARRLPKKDVEPVPGYPVNYSAIARTPKPAVLLGGGTPDEAEAADARAAVEALNTSVSTGAPVAPELDSADAAGAGDDTTTTTRTRRARA